MRINGFLCRMWTGRCLSMGMDRSTTFLAAPDSVATPCQPLIPHFIELGTLPSQAILSPLQRSPTRSGHTCCPRIFKAVCRFLCLSLVDNNSWCFIIACRSSSRQHLVGTALKPPLPAHKSDECSSSPYLQ